MTHSEADKKYVKAHDSSVYLLFPADSLMHVHTAATKEHNNKIYLILDAWQKCLPLLA